MLPLVSAILGTLIGSIVIRHDVDPALYDADPADFPAAFELFKGDGMATVVAPSWALTAAHVAVDLENRPGHTVIIAGEERTIEAVVLHPDWDRRRGQNDAGLVRFSPPVAETLPAGLYRESDEVGQIVTFVGTGDFGTGLTGGTVRDERWRAATNRVERATATDVVFAFDAPGTEGVTELEGISGPGDSGGPALVERDGAVMIMGVSSRGSEPEGQTPGTYGSLEYYTRVSAIAGWIDDVVSGSR